MSYQYATAEQLKQLALPEIDITDETVLAQVNAILAGVSAGIDRYCDRPAGYFSPSAEEPTTRRIRAEGQNYLRIGRHVGDVEFTNPVVSSTVFYQAENGWIYWNEQPVSGDADYFAQADKFFEANRIYIVSARWGFEATPDDIVLATALIAGDLYDRGNGVIGQVSPTGFVIERAMPLPARELLNGWKRREFEIN